ncbi:unnamed protein product [Closterium sp. Naga37s-1]|nr:unnamed protein product [Closterium sp. Naga37s-1]
MAPSVIGTGRYSHFQAAGSAAAGEGLDITNGGAGVTSHSSVTSILLDSPPPHAQWHVASCQSPPVCPRMAPFLGPPGLEPLGLGGDGGEGRGEDPGEGDGADGEDGGAEEGRLGEGSTSGDRGSEGKGRGGGVWVCENPQYVDLGGVAGGSGGSSGGKGGSGGVQWAEWAGRVHELGNVFVSSEGWVFNATHVFHANGCHGLTQFFYPFGTRVTIHDTLVNLLVPRGHVAAADVAGSRGRSGATVLQLAPLLLQVAPFLRENPDLPLLLGQPRLPRMLAAASLKATIVAPPAADELYFVRRLIQPTQQHCGRLSPSVWIHLRSSFLLHPSSNHLPLLQPDWSLRPAAGGTDQEKSSHLDSSEREDDSSGIGEESGGRNRDDREGEGEEGGEGSVNGVREQGKVVVVTMPRGVQMAEFDWLVGLLRQQFGESNVTVVQRLGWKQARTLLPCTSLLVSLPLPSLLPLLIYSRLNSSLLLLQPPTGLSLPHSLPSSSSSSSSSLTHSKDDSLPSQPLLSNPSPDPFLSSSSIIQSMSATCHLHVVSVPSERLNFKPLPKLWLVTEPEVREDGKMDIGDSQGGGSAVGAEGGGLEMDATVTDADERRENGDERNNDDADWGEEAAEEGEGESKAKQGAGKREEEEVERGEEVERRREQEEDVRGIRITWSREDLGEAVSEACLHLALDCLRLGSRGAATAEERVSEAERKKRERLDKKLRRREAEAWKVPGSWLRRRRDVRVFERWLECISREGNWVYNPTPRVLPWEYPGFMNLCDHRQADEGVGVSGIKADEVVRRGGSEEEWTVRESLKYEWRTPPGKCPLGGLKPFDGAAFCKRAREERGTFTIVFLGDSLTFQMAGSFLNGLLRHVAKPASWAVDESEPKQCVDWLLGRGGGGGGAGAGAGVSEDGSKKLRRAARWRNLRSRDGNTSAATGVGTVGEEEGEEEEEEDDEDGGIAPVVVTPHPFCKVYVFHENVCPGVKIHVIRNDHLYIQDPDLTSPADGSSTTSSSIGSATSGSVPFDHMPWHLYDGLMSADVVIINRGAHYVGGRDFGAGCHEAASQEASSCADRL